MANVDDFNERKLPHLSIDSFRAVQRYTPPRRRIEPQPIRDNYAAHSQALLDQLAVAFGLLPPLGQDPRLDIPGLAKGTVIEVATLPLTEGSRSVARKFPQDLDYPAQGIAQLTTSRREDRTETALLFVPDTARGYLRDRISTYGRDPGNARRTGLAEFEVIETISPTDGASLFVGQVDQGSPTAIWWEIWVSGDTQRADRVLELAQGQGFDVHPSRLQFPDTTVVFVHGTATAIAAFADKVPGAISQIGSAAATASLFLDRGAAGTDQHDWVAHLADRLVVSGEGAPVVCVLDTGIAAAHPLIAPGLKGAWAYVDQWGSDDHYPHGGHGTGVAGLALIGDLDDALNQAGPFRLTHDIESMKVLPPQGFPANHPSAFGTITQGAVAKVELERPHQARTFCMAISATDFHASAPSSWSGAIDQIASGSMPGETNEHASAANSPKRLFLVATGNVHGGQLANVTQVHSIEDPAQSWNAISIGGFTRKASVPDPPPVFTPVAVENDRSPFSLGSRSLPNDLTPIKPELLFEAGNMLADETGYCDWNETVALVAPGSDITAMPLAPFWATSAAVGMAGQFFGELQARLPNIWPETHRALAIDSAQWPTPIRKRLIGTGAHWKTNTKAEKQKILREVGYGVPDIRRAVQSSRNDVSLIAQSTIQPFRLAEDGRSALFNEINYYELPWPSAALQALESQVVTMKACLSYFVEPNLNGKAATRPTTYRSFGLRFAFKKRTESSEAFQARINSAQEDESRVAASEADYWLLGSKAIQAGSLHCDLWRGYAVDLAGHDAVAVYPVTGWWKTHIGQRRANDLARYALVISIHAPGLPVDLYTEISNKIAAKVRVSIDVA